MSRRPRLRRVADAWSPLFAWTGAAVLLASVTGCGIGEPESADPGSRGSPTASPAAASPTAARPTASEPAQSASPPAGRPVEAAGFVQTISRSLDRSTTARLELEVTTPEVSATGRGAVDYTGSSPAVQLWMQVPMLGEGTIETRLLDGVLYVAMPMLEPDGTFFRVDLSDPDNPLGGGGSAGGGVGALDPRAALRALGAGVREVRLVGRERVGHDSTRHYWIGADGASLQGLLGSDQPGASGPRAPGEVVAFHVWLDRADRVRRLATDLGGAGSVEMRLSDWGRPVTITAPPASQVEEMPQG